MFNRIAIIGVLIAVVSAPCWAQTSTVLVFPFENLSSDRNLEWIGEGIGELVVDRLRSEPGLFLFSRDDRLNAYDRIGIHENAAISRATAVKLGWDMGADFIVTGTFSGTHEDFGVDARIVNLAVGQSSEPYKVRGKLDDVLSLTNSLSGELLQNLVPGTKVPEFDYTSRPPAPLSAFEDYIRGLLSPDPQKRIDLFQDAVRLHPQYVSAIFQLGRLLSTERRFKESNTWLEKFGNATPEFTEAQFTCALNYIYLLDYPRAIKILVGLPPTYDVLVNLGVALADNGDIAGALDKFKRAVQVNPLGSEAPFNMAYLSLSSGDAETAVRSLEQFLKLQGRDGEALFLMARTYERLGRTEDSQRAMNQATRLSARVERWVGQPLPKLERLRAETSFGQVEWTSQRLARRARGQDMASWIESVQKLVDSQLYGDAIRELQDLTRVFPNSSDAHLLIAQVYTRQRDYDHAAQEIDITLRLAPDDSAALKLKEDLEKQSTRRNRQ